MRATGVNQYGKYFDIPLRDGVYLTPGSVISHEVIEQHGGETVIVLYEHAIVKCECLGSQNKWECVFETVRNIGHLPNRHSWDLAQSKGVLRQRSSPFALLMQHASKDFCSLVFDRVCAGNYEGRHRKEEPIVTPCTWRKMGNYAD